MIGKLDVDGPHVLIEVSDSLRTGDGHDVVTFGQQPSESNLTRGGAMVRRYAADLVRRTHVGIERITLESRMNATEVRFAEGIAAAERTGEHAAAEWG